MTEKKEEPKELTSEQMKELLRQNERKNMEVCMQKINAALQEHKYRLTSIVIIQDGQVSSSRIDLVAVK